jgi:N-acetylglucosamine-6-phosphate deacetylase
LSHSPRLTLFFEGKNKQKLFMTKKQEANITQIKGRLASDGQPVTIDISEGRIANITPSEGSYNCDGLPFISPRLIDNQVNGYLRIDFSEPGLTTKKVEKVTRALWEKGVTSYLPTLITSSRSRLTDNLTILRKAQADE